MLGGRCLGSSERYGGWDNMHVKRWAVMYGLPIKV